MIEQRPPTHILRVLVPLHLTEPQPDDFNAADDAIKICLSVSRGVYTGAICDEPAVTLMEAADADA